MVAARRYFPAGHPLASVDITVLEREEDFLIRRWRYRAGQHATFLGRNGSGKTRLQYQLLAVTATPKLPALNLLYKPRDDTATDFGRLQGYVRTRDWPPQRNPFAPRPAGYNVWPPTVFDPRTDNIRMWNTHRRAILDSYKRGNRILVADEITALTHEIKNPDEKNRTLLDECEAVWQRGRSMGCGLWGGSQRPAWISTLAYGQAEHLFLFAEFDLRYRKRFGEIGGVDSELVSHVTEHLPEYHCLYIRRKDRAYCIIGP